MCDLLRQVVKLMHEGQQSDDIRIAANKIITSVRSDERERCVQVVNSLKWSESYDKGFVNNVAADYNATLGDVINAIKAE